MNSKFYDIAIKGIQCVIPGDSDMAKKQKVSDLCYAATEKLLDKLQWSKDDIRVLILVTQTSDYLIPSTASLLQKRLGIGFDCLAYDINLGGTGFLIGMQLAASLLSSFGEGSKGILVTGDAAFNEEEILKDVLPCGAATGIVFGEKGEFACRNFSYSKEFDVILQERKKGKIIFNRKKLKDVLKKCIFEETKSLLNNERHQQTDYLVTNLDDEDFFFMDNVDIIQKGSICRRISINNSAMIPALICENKECLKEHNNLLVAAAGAGCLLATGLIEIYKDSLCKVEKVNEYYIDKIQQL